MESVNECVDTWCKYHGINKFILWEWKCEFIRKIDEKMKSFFNNISAEYYKNVFQQNQHFNILNNAQDEFLLLHQIKLIQTLHLLVNPTRVGLFLATYGWRGREQFNPSLLKSLIMMLFTWNLVHLFFDITGTKW